MPWECPAPCRGVLPDAAPRASACSGLGRSLSDKSCTDPSASRAGKRRWRQQRGFYAEAPSAGPFCQGAGGWGWGYGPSDPFPFPTAASAGAFSSVMSSPASADLGHPAPAWPWVPWALCSGLAAVTLPCLLQSVSPGCIHTVLLLAEKELVAHRERLPGVQVSPAPSPSPPPVPALSPVGKAEPGRKGSPTLGTLCPLTRRPQSPCWGALGRAAPRWADPPPRVRGQALGLAGLRRQANDAQGQPSAFPVPSHGRPQALGQ